QIQHYSNPKIFPISPAALQRAASAHNRDSFATNVDALYCPPMLHHAATFSLLLSLTFCVHSYPICSLRCSGEAEEEEQNQVELRDLQPEAIGSQILSPGIHAQGPSQPLRGEKGKDIFSASMR
ncbi:hypothetical protein CR513_62736, partial [Mucuna pruriens]